mgnify:CR=1 FL=1
MEWTIEEIDEFVLDLDELMFPKTPVQINYINPLLLKRPTKKRKTRQPLIDFTYINVNLSDLFDLQYVENTSLKTPEKIRTISSVPKKPIKKRKIL